MANTALNLATAIVGCPGQATATCTDANAAVLITVPSRARISVQFKSNAGLLNLNGSVANNDAITSADWVDAPAGSIVTFVTGGSDRRGPENAVSTFAIGSASAGTKCVIVWEEVA